MNVIDEYLVGFIRIVKSVDFGVSWELVRGFVHRVKGRR